MIDLSGRVAIVTGASRGIGRAIALRLAAQRASVIAAAGGRAEAMTLDVTDALAVEAAVRGTTERHGRIDILVSNAGITRDQLMLRLKRDDWDAVMETNLTSAYTLTQAVLKPMIRQRAGRIICISSVVGQSGNPGQANYAASKAGLIGFAKAVALEVASRNITVNVVAPGMIETDMTRELANKAREALVSRIPVGRLGTPDEVASAVCFLASDEASYITGQVLGVNGGMYT
jgi:3-oxoacyl-[acyl-carrier protein] reductase